MKYSSIMSPTTPSILGRSFTVVKALPCRINYPDACKNRVYRILLWHQLYSMEIPMDIKHIIISPLWILLPSSHPISSNIMTGTVWSTNNRRQRKSDQNDIKFLSFLPFITVKNRPFSYYIITNTFELPISHSLSLARELRASLDKITRF